MKNMAEEDIKPLKENLNNLKNVVRANIAGSVIIEKDNKYLLVQEKLETCYGKWNLPGGLVDEGINIEKTAVKEAKEETGYDVKLIKKIGVFHNDGEKAVKHVFEAEVVGGKMNVPNEEIMDAKWFTYEEINKMKNKLRNLWIIDVIESYLKEKKINESLNGWKRCLADFENFRKQQDVRQAEFRKFAAADLISQILPILDNFHASTDHVPEDQKENPWVVGIMHIQKQLEGVLKDNGVEEIMTKVGDQFDHNIHEAVADQKQQDVSEKKDKNKITKIASKGYKIDGKVIRPARVVVN